MNYLAASVMTIFAFPCLAATLAEQFSLMDINKDGFLSETEFVNGMQTAKETTSLPAAAAQTVPDAAKKKLLMTRLFRLKKSAV